MKIIHTADIHLTEKKNRFHSYRWKALERVIEKANETGAGMITISGDLFDSLRAAEELRNEIRALFERFKGRVVIIPGNHDAEAFPKGAYFGANVHVIRNPGEPFKAEGFPEVWGLPFSGMQKEDTLATLKSLSQGVGMGENSILLFHGELLDVSGDWTSYGDEGQKRYHPVKLSYFEKLPWRYILAGHFHTNFSVSTFGWEKRGGKQVRQSGGSGAGGESRKSTEAGKTSTGFFVYPGSPVSITSKETGIRKVNVLEPGGEPKELELDTFHYEEVDVELSPFDRQSPVARVEAALKAAPKGASLLLRVGGYFDGERWKVSEERLAKEIEKLGRALEIPEMEVPALEFHDVGKILSDEIYVRFMKKLKAMQVDDDTRFLMQRILMRAIMRVTR